MYFIFLAYSVPLIQCCSIILYVFLIPGTVDMGYFLKSSMQHFFLFHMYFARLLKMNTLHSVTESILPTHTHTHINHFLCIMHNTWLMTGLVSCISVPVGFIHSFISLFSIDPTGYNHLDIGIVKLIIHCAFSAFVIYT